MSKLDALKDLLAKVEAGGNPTQAQWHEVFPDTPEDDDYSRSMMATAACVGGIDAAKALHEAVLPGWSWVFSSWGSGHVTPREGKYSSMAQTGHSAGDPARAWLIAILKALISEETP